MIVNKFLMKFFFLLLVPIITLIISYNGIENDTTICIFKNIIGSECMGCGTTRAIISFIGGNFHKSIDYNYNVILVFPLIVFIWFKYIYLSYLELINNY